MTTAVVIATGQSLCDEELRLVRMAHICGSIDYVIAVSNAAIDKAPWADAMASMDKNWWQAYPDHKHFPGRKFSPHGYEDTEAFREGVRTFYNSGLYAMFIARDVYRATRLVLLGFDMHGTHYFGPHAGGGYKPLVNTGKARFEEHIKQFHLFGGCEVYNATQGSALNAYPKVNLREFLGAD